MTSHVSLAGPNEVHLPLGVSPHPLDLSDNTAAAYHVRRPDGAGGYLDVIVVTTTNGAEEIVLGDATDLPEITSYSTYTLKERASAPALTANRGKLYTKDVSGVTELWYLDSAGNAVQITEAGAVGGSGSAGPYTVTTVSSGTHNVSAEQQVLHVTYTATGAVTINLRAAATAGAGAWLKIVDAGGSAGTNNITIDGNGSETINGSTTFVINTNRGAVEIYCDGSNWFVGP